MPPPGAGQDLAIAHAVESDNYDAYIGRAALAIVVDVEGTAAAFERLAADPDLRRRMGENAARRAREAFDWKVVVGAYEDLWSELDAERRSAKDEDPPSKLRSWPSRLDPFTLFKGYPTQPLDPTQTIRLTPSASTAAFETRLRLNIASYATSEGFTMERLTALRDALRGKGMTVAEFLERLPPAQQAPAVRALLLLAKFGLVEIGPPARSTATPSPSE